MIVARPFSPTDIPGVMSVVKSSLGETYPPSLYLTVHNLWGEGFITVSDGSEIIGFVAAVPTGEKSARILMLAVSPEHRNEGLGQMLMRALYASALARGYGSIVLEVRKSNREAISFYELQGFVLFGEIENFYSNGEGAFKFMKTLGS